MSGSVPKAGVGRVPPGAPTDPAALPTTGVRVLNIANAVTILRLLLVPVCAVALLHQDGQSNGWRLTAFVIFVVASLTDRLDGELARSRHLITDFGKIADPIADKALTGTALIVLSAIGGLPWWVTLVVLVREVGVTLLRFMVIRHGVIAASRGGKLKTALQTAAIALYILPGAGLLGEVRPWLMGLAVVVTVLTGVDYLARALRLRTTSERARARRARREARTVASSAPPTASTQVVDREAAERRP
jgi:CDP-diacylglycerol---glycerol-3-phosphate 3-phosphatidyltransferase